LAALSKRRPSSELERRIMKDRVRDLTLRDPLLVPPATPVGETLRRLVDRSVGCAVVVEDGRVVGIFTERDLLERLNAQAAEMADRPISEFMSRPVETLELDDRVAFAVNKMDLGGYRHLPILSEGRVVGLISVRNILSHITSAM
jgi:CBS domain-containing protein